MPASIKVKVLYFAQAREAAGASEEEITLPYPAFIDSLFTKILEYHPDIETIREIVSVSVNYKIMNENIALRKGDEIALLPPVTGG
jgi:molybdopterin converting factor subunit 1